MTAAAAMHAAASATLHHQGRRPKPRVHTAQHRSDVSGHVMTAIPAVPAHTPSAMAHTRRHTRPVHFHKRDDELPARIEGVPKAQFAAHVRPAIEFKEQNDMPWLWRWCDGVWRVACRLRHGIRFTTQTASCCWAGRR